MLPIGVLCLQGDFREHLAVLEKLAIPSIRVRKPSDLTQISGLIIPGGESTVIDKLSRSSGIREPAMKLIAQGLPVFGTCAGLIMLAGEIEGAIQGQQNFGGLDVTVARNAFGSQTNSFEATLNFVGIEEPISVAFIRAPVVTRIGKGVQVLSSLDDGRVVAVRSGNILGVSFHPEVTQVTTVHEYFAEMCKTANFGVAN